MRGRVVRILVALSSVAMIAIAGGASLRGFYYGWPITSLAAFAVE
jgi:hypothetical protein